jgi:hypothetical protein
MYQIRSFANITEIQNGKLPQKLVYEIPFSGILIHLQRLAFL